VEAGGLFLIGDGLVALLWPRRYTMLWHVGPQLGRAAIEELADHPRLARSVYAAEVALGIALFASQTSKHI
jgi:hypothetical protein